MTIFLQNSYGMLYIIWRKQPFRSTEVDYDSDSGQGDTASDSRVSLPDLDTIHSIEACQFYDGAASE